MDVHIEQADVTVRAVDDRSLLSPDVLERIVEAVIARMAERRAEESRQSSDRQLWRSVRDRSHR